MLNSVEASTQPCLTPFVTGNGSENSPSFWTLASIPSWNCRTIAMNLAGQPKLCHNFPKSVTTDCVKCFGKVDNGHVEVHILFLAFVLKLSCRAVKIMSVVPLFFPEYNTYNTNIHKLYKGSGNKLSIDYVKSSPRYVEPRYIELL